MALLGAVLGTGVALGQTLPPDIRTWRDDHLHQLGNSLAAAAPDAVRKDPLRLARQAFSDYCAVLKASGHPLNDGNLTRVSSAIAGAISEPSVIGILDGASVGRLNWSCGDHATRLRSIIESALKEAGHTVEMIGVVGERPLAAPGDPNRNHGALMVVIDGQAYVFDAWLNAVTNGRKYDPALGNRYNGMSLKDWQQDVLTRGYRRIAVVGEPFSEDVEKHSPWLVERVLREEIQKVLAAAAGQRPPGSGYWKLKEVRRATADEGYPQEFARYWSGGHGSMAAKSDVGHFEDAKGNACASRGEASLKWSIRPLAYLRANGRIDVTLTAQSGWALTPWPGEFPTVAAYANLDGHDLFNRPDPASKPVVLAAPGTVTATSGTAVPTGVAGQLLVLRMTLSAPPLGASGGQMVYVWEWIGE